MYTVTLSIAIGMIVAWLLWTSLLCSHGLLAHILDSVSTSSSVHRTRYVMHFVKKMHMLT